LYVGYTDTLFGVSHSFVVAQDPLTGQEYATRAGPNVNGSLGPKNPNQPWGTIFAIAGPFNSSFTDYNNQNAPLQYAGTVDISFAAEATEMS